MEIIKKLSIVVSVYNEEAVLDKFYQAIYPVVQSLDSDYELIFVNDGSKDASPAILDRLAMDSHKVKVIHFSRNYGHEAAMIAGIDYSSGDGVICMDADLQHPVECIPQILDTFNQGYEVISMVRTANKSAGLIKNVTSELFYKLLNKISDTHFEENASDFFAVTRKPVEVLKKHFRESSRFLRAYVQSIGFKKTTLEYEAHDRVAGESKYSIRSLFKFSVQAMLSYSDLPLQIASVCGTFAGIACLILIIYSIYMKVHVGAPGGYTTIIVVLCFMFTVLFFLLGIIGEYLSIILGEVRKRPIYLVRDAVNFEEEQGKK
nr:glycosyltransferase family 2 protein [uncultured Anaerobutyricum sp.]